MGILDFLTADYATRQDRTRRLREGMEGLLGYYLGPTGIPDRLSSANALLNPIDQIGEAGANTVVAFDPTRSKQDRIAAALNAGLGTITAAAPAIGGAIAGQPARRALMETLVGASDQVDDAAARLAADIQARGGALAADATGLGRGLLARDPEMIGEVFQPSGTARGLSADVPNTLRTTDDIFADVMDKYPNVKLDIYGSPELGFTIGRIEVPEGQRNSGIGSNVMREVLDRADQVGAQVNLTPSDAFGGNVNRLRDFYRNLGFVENRGRNKDFSTRETMYRTPQQSILPTNRDAAAGAIALPAARTEAEAVARQILEMRAAGRAGDVTEAMMAQADPQYMFKNTPLPMDYESRMGRAIQAGFDVENSLTHGSKRDIYGFSLNAPKGTDFGWYGQGVYLAPNNPSMSDAYAMVEKEGMGKWGGRTYPVMSRGRMYEWPEFNPPATSLGQSQELTQSLRGLGYEGANAYAPNDPDIWGEAAGSWREQTVYDPRNIRSRFARFDPEFRHLANLNASVALPLPLVGILAAQREDERQRQPSLLGGR